MKTIFGSRKYHYVVRVSIFLIVIALVAGMVSCSCGGGGGGGGGGGAQYNLTMVASPTVGGTATDLTDESPYAEGAEVSIKAEANEGYGFVKWTAPAGELDDANAEETTFTMPAQNVTVTANFDVAYNLSISSTAGGSVTTPGEVTFSYAQGKVVNLVVTPAGGYYFDNWTGDVGTIANINAVTTTITMNDNYDITANFKQIPPGKFALTTSSTAGGSVTTPGEATFIYDQGTVVNLVATPAGGYYFDNWTGDVGTIANVNAATTTITMNDNYDITANFKISQGQFTLTTSSTAGGLVTTPGEGTFPYNDGTVVNLVATPASGYRFVNWTGNVGTVANVNAATTTITMDADYSITANFVAVYYLTMAVAPPGSGTATDLTNASPYPAGTVVNIQAQAAAGCQFVIWTAPAGTFANPNAATTTFTMPAQNVTATAHFVEPLDHFKCYWIENDVFIGEDVYLEDQFGALEAEVDWAYYFCNPVEKWHDEDLTPIWNPDHHLTLYDLYYEEAPQMWSVEVDNQFGRQELIVEGPVGLAVPTQKVEPGGHEPPVGLDHFLLYVVIEGPDVDVVVGLNDQFGDQPEVSLTYPVLFATPVQKTLMEGGVASGDVYPIQNPDQHLVFYNIWGDSVNYPQVQVVNQFGEQTFAMYDPYYLAVPSEKISFEPFELELDHFECYWIGGEEQLPVQHGALYLEDQFCALEVELGQPWYFCNPTEKLYDQLVSPILDPDHHFLFYEIIYQEEPEWWGVEVYNQFGIQELTVWGPVALAVPTHKLEPGLHDPPVGLDHFLLYEVSDAWPEMGNVLVGLNDQFSYEQEDFWVTQPVFFANPVQKTHDGDVTPIQHPEAHLVFYDIQGPDYSYPPIQVVNQFEATTYNQVWGPYLLAAPSLKLSAWQL